MREALIDGLCGRGGLLELTPPSTDPVRSHEEVAGGEWAGDFEVAYSGESHGGDAAALRTVRVSAELAGGDCGLEVSGDGLCRSGEDALHRTFGRVGDLVDDDVVHVQLGVLGAQGAEFRDDGEALGG